MSQIDLAYYFLVDLGKPELDEVWSINRILTVYAQRAFITLASDKEQRQKLGYKKWAKTAPSADADVVKKAIIEGQTRKPRKVR